MSASFFSAFASNAYVRGGQEFLESNSIVAKFAFLILALIVFMLVLRMATSLLSYIFTPSSSPILIKGLINAKQMLRIPQDPAQRNAKPILRSINTDDGLEFTWAVWIYVDDFTYKLNEFKHVFHKGNSNINVTPGSTTLGMNYPNNGPGLYITPNENNLLVVMNTFDKIQEDITVKDLPLNKWVHVVMRVSKQHQLDVYINGSLAKRHQLSSVPKQNYGDVYVSMNGGFSGYTSSLRYFSEALGTNQIRSLLYDGPNLKVVGDESLNPKDVAPQYLSSRWYFRGADDTN
jgi:hypothetical protein